MNAALAASSTECPLPSLPWCAERHKAREPVAYGVAWGTYGNTGLVEQPIVGMYW